MTAGDQRVGPYVLVRPLARGGMGVVYEAARPDGARVALKVLTDPSRPDAIARFDRERRLLAELSSMPGFVPLLDAGEHQGRPWLVMPLMAGGSLRQRLASGPLGVDAAVALGQHLALAIGRAHAAGIVHRDLKPENVLFERPGDDAPRIADLGVARHFRASGHEDARGETLSRTGALIGSACYMAPEQVTDARAVGPPADVFALGQIVYECVAGVTPFAGESLHETLTALLEGTFAPLRARAPDAPEWLEAVVARALARDPRDRWPDGLALARALARREPTVTTPRAPGRRRAALLAAAGVALTAAVAVGAASLTTSHAPPSPPPTTTPPAPIVPAAAPGPSLDEARAAVRAGDLPRALALCQDALAAAPDAPEWLALRGVARGGDEGLADVDRAIQLAPAAWMHAERAALRLERGDPAGARADLDRCLALEPRTARVLVLSARVAIAARDLTRARRDAEGATVLAPDDGAAWITLAKARRLGNDPAGALEAAQRATELAPDQAEAWFELGICQTMARRFQEALDALGRALELDPGHVEAWAVRGATRSIVGDHRAAVVDLERAVAAAPNKAGLWLNLSTARRAARDAAGARAAADRAVELDPGLSPAFAARALALERLGEVEAARADLERCFELSPAMARDPELQALRERLQR